MTTAKFIDETISNLEFELAKQKAIRKEFPNAKVHYLTGFNSKDVNQKYTNFDFIRKQYGVYVLPYCQVNFEFNGNQEMVKVYSSPRSNRLTYLKWVGRDAGYVIRFSRMNINFKAHQFKDDMLASCRTEIMEFIKKHPNLKLDNKHLEPKLKKLLVFV